MYEMLNAVKKTGIAVVGIAMPSLLVKINLINCYGIVKMQYGCILFIGKG
jgi:hypothetical protein